jgi:hypothetical protein
MPRRDPALEDAIREIASSSVIRVYGSSDAFCAVLRQALDLPWHRWLLLRLVFAMSSLC